MNQKTVQAPVANSESVLAHIDAATAALTALKAVNEQLVGKLEGNEENPLGSRNLLVQMLQNLRSYRYHVSKGILNDHMGNHVGAFGDLAEILGREEDMSQYIDN